MKRTLIVSLIAFTMLLGGCGNAAHEASQSVETQTTVTQESQETTESSSGSTTETESTTSSEPETASSTQTSETKESKESKEKDSTTSTAEKEKETKATSTATKTSKETKSTTTSQENKNTTASSSQKSDKTSDTKNSGTEQEEKTNPPSKDTSSTGNSNSNSPNNEPSKEPEQHVCSFDGGTVTTAATCSSAGVKTYRCSCGATKTETIAATGHQMTTENTAGSCTEAGKSKTYCKVCGYVESETTSGAAKGHVEGEWTCVLPPECNYGGSYVVRCGVCGEYMDTKEGTAPGHSFDGGVKEGSPCWGYATTYTCTVCGWQEKEEEDGTGCIDSDNDGVCDNCGIIM